MSSTPTSRPRRRRTRPHLNRALSISILAALTAALIVSLPVSAAPASAPAKAAGAWGIIRGAWNWFIEGGAFMWPIAICSVVGVGFIIERAVALRRSRVIPDGLKEALERRLDELDVAGAIADCDAKPSPFARVVQAALRRDWASIQEMEKAAEDSGIREFWHMRRNMQPIGTVATVAPLLGLLGTVSGLITAFDTMSRGETMGNPSAFAGAIHEALYTTYLGLCVAIPVLLCFYWLRARAEGLISEVELTTSDLLIRLRNGRAQPDAAQPQAVRTDR